MLISCMIANYNSSSSNKLLDFLLAMNASLESLLYFAALFVLNIFYDPAQFGFGAF